MREDLKLSNQLCFPVYALSRQVTTIYRPHLDKLGLTYPQYLVLMVLWEHRAITVKQLGEILFLDSGTLTPLLKRMEINGLLRRSRSSKDERVVDIVITEKGEKLQEEAAHIPCIIKQALSITDTQLIELRKQLNNLLAITGEYNNRI